MATSEKCSSMDSRNSSMFLVPGFGPSRKKRQENWTTESTFALVNVWRDNIGALRSLKRNGHIYQKIAHQLHLAGFQRATFEVKTKIGNLTNEYRRERKRLEAEGGASRFKFWDVIHEMMTSDVMTISDGSTSREGFEDDDDSLFSIGDELVFPASMNPVSITSEWSPVDNGNDDDRLVIDHEIPEDEDEDEEDQEREEHENHETEEGSFPTKLSPLNHDLNLKIKQEVSKESEEEEEKDQECNESRLLGESSFVTTQRQKSTPSNSQRAKCRKRKFRTEDERLKIMNMMYEENRRMNAATQRAEKEILALMREQTDLQRQSMIVEERIARAIESACRALTSSSTMTASPLKRQCNGSSANGHS